MNKLSTVVLAAAVVMVGAKLCLYTVGEREHALVFALGELKEVQSEPGLHFKLPPPLQNVVYLDKRILTLDAPTADLVQTSEKKNLMIDSRVNDIGVEVVDVRLKRVDFTPEISESVYRRMEAERKRVASEERSTGAAQAEKIRADADRQREVILAEAYRKAQEVRGEGDAQANATYAEAFSRDPEFARFYRNIEAYRTSFAEKNDVMVVDPSSDFFKYMKDPKKQ